MRKWWVKCALQGALAYIPGGRSVSEWRSRRFELPSLDWRALEQAALHARMLAESGIGITGKTVLEFGAGWKPIAALVFRILGASRVLLYDLYPHMDHELLAATVGQLRADSARVAGILGVAAAAVESSLPDPGSMEFDALLESCGINYRAPHDVSKTGLPDESVGIVTSRAVLEHIPPDAIQEIYLEMRRILRPGGAMVHTIDHSDHWQHGDHSISRINYLKFSPLQWRLINNPISYQNRLRARTHLELMRETGFEIACCREISDPGALSDARRLRLHSDFGGFSPEDLAVMTTHIVARPASIEKAAESAALLPS